MRVIPAIDLLEGAAVRLAEGERSRATVYEREPVALARAFARAGAPLVHVVDLEGAFAGRPIQLALVRELCAVLHEAGARVQVGGGVRDRAAIETLLACGADRVVVGTLAIREPETVAATCHAHPSRIVVAVDARDGMVAVDGWTTKTEIAASDLARDAEAFGAVALLFTDIARDGLQVGPAVAATAALQSSVGIDVIASGGVGSIADLVRLRDAGVRSAIVGRALYERSFTLEEALATC
jgi:phosphoribosylformimino-5-aminoimidazole carboxamide ribotide isomerase